MKYRFFKSVVFTFLSLSCSITAQHSKKYFVEARGFYGNGTGNIKGIESNVMRGVALGVGKNLDPNTSEWIDKLNAKKVSLNFVYTDLNGMQRGFKYGESYALSTKLDFQLLKYKAFSLSVSPEVGLAYMTETVATIPDSYIFGSHVNFLFGVGFSSAIQLNQDWSVNPYVQLLHYSNGSIKIPNAGANAVVYGLGVQKTIGDTKEHSPQKYTSSKDSLKTNALELMAGIGWRGKYKSNDHFFRAGFYAGYSRYLNSFFALRGGVDVVYYDQVYNPDVYDDTIPYWGKSYDHLRAGVSLGAELKFGKLALNYNVGRYLHMNSPYHQKMYWNAAFRYYLTPKFGVQGTLNAHKFQADFLNFGIFCRL